MAYFSASGLMVPETDLDALDLFCGLGGSTLGMEMAGVHVLHAANHWSLAIDVHQLNHPKTDASKVDITDASPYFFPKTQILWASPECTNHSMAKRHKAKQQLKIGEDGRVVDVPAARSRVQMNDVPRFMQDARRRGAPYKYVVVENVVDIARWDGFHDWLKELNRLGYSWEVVSLNSQFAHSRNGAGSAQSRDRVYVVCWDSKSGIPAPDLDIRPPAACEECDEVVEAVQIFRDPRKLIGRFRAQYDYQCPNVGCQSLVQPLARPSWEFLDWSAPAEVIGDRFVENTRRRIVAGLARYGAPVAVDVNGRSRRGRVSAWTTSHALGIQPRRNIVDRKLVPAVTTSTPEFARHGRIDDSTRRAVNAIRFMAGQDLPTAPIQVNDREMVIPGGLMLRNFTERGDPSQMGSPFVEPVRTITGAGNQSVIIVPWSQAEVIGNLEAMLSSGQAPVRVINSVLESVLNRPITPQEMKVLMGFPDTYQSMGNMDQQRQMFGNAVTPPAATILMERCVQAIYPELAVERSYQPAQHLAERSIA